MKTVLWWGRFDADYSRNRVLLAAFNSLGWEIREFRPRISVLADWEAHWRGLARPDAVWVPCFRQRDVIAARRWCDRSGVPLVFDPLISSYDKQVCERRKFSPDSLRALRLLKKERRIFAAADRLVADTIGHAAFFRDTLGASADRTLVIPVGAEEARFFPADTSRPGSGPIEILFYGSFLSLQGPQVIIEAARRYVGLPVRWCLLGTGPLRAACETAAIGLANVTFEDWIPYAQLPDRIRRADVTLGIFGDSDKAARVIPNKAYQSLACGKPLVTRVSTAYPPELLSSADAGISWVAPNDPGALARAVAVIASAPQDLSARGRSARESYDRFFSSRIIEEKLARVLASIDLA